MADTEDVDYDSENDTISAKGDEIPIVYIKTSATIISVNGIFTTTTVTRVTYTDGIEKEDTELADGKVHAKRRMPSAFTTESFSNRNTTTKNGITTTTAYEKYIYGFEKPVVTEEVINSESGPTERVIGCCSCSIM